MAFRREPLASNCSSSLFGLAWLNGVGADSGRPLEENINRKPPSHHHNGRSEAHHPGLGWGLP
jgi:hypothetical protein